MKCMMSIIFIHTVLSSISLGIWINVFDDCASDRFGESVMNGYSNFIKYIDKSKTMIGKFIYCIVIVILTLLGLPMLFIGGLSYLIGEFIDNNYD